MKGLGRTLQPCLEDLKIPIMEPWMQLHEWRHLHGLSHSCRMFILIFCLYSWQGSLTERKKKDVDLHSRPPLLRRPVTSSVERKAVGKPRRLPFEISRCSTSPPIPDLGATPLQYVAPKLTTLYNIAEPVNKQRIGNQSRTSSPRTSTHCRPASATSFRASSPCHLHARSNSRGWDSQESGVCVPELSHAHNGCFLGFNVVETSGITIVTAGWLWPSYPPHVRVILMCLGMKVNACPHDRHRGYALKKWQSPNAQGRGQTRGLAASKPPIVSWAAGLHRRSRSHQGSGAMHSTSHNNKVR